MNKVFFSSTLATVAVAALVVGAVALSRRHPPTVERIILLGFDGASPNLLEPLVAQGQLPAIRRLMESGSYGHLRSFHPAKSAVLWTSVATGKTMLKHGIVDWTYVNSQGLTVPYQDEGRRVKTYWEILGERGLKTGTLNWWVSHPPRPVPNGYVVSDFFRRRRQPDTVDPPTLFDWLNALRLKLDGVPVEMKRQSIPEWRDEDLTVPLGPKELTLYSYPSFFAQDITIDRASDFLWHQHPVQVFSTYFRLVDVTSHFAVHFVDRGVYDEVATLAASGGATAADLARLDLDMARVMAPTYRFMDRIVAKYLDRMDEHTALIVCSDHGFRFFEGLYDHRATAVEAPDGVLFLAGPGVRKGGRITGARLFDIAPTILHWMGQPVAEDMDGDVLAAALGGSSRASVRRIASYEKGERRGSSSTDPAVSAQALEDLRALGYIQGPAEASPRPSPTPSQR
jgi:hypothetical protein